MNQTGPGNTRYFRTVFLSDVHLGFKGCQSKYLLDFLHSIECDTLYLVGDIIDIWNMKRGLYWPQEHNNVIRHILGMAKRGVRVVYVPGNHDELLREYDGMVFGNVEIVREAVHEMEDGRRFLVIHGDEFDSVVKCSKWLAKLGTHAYDWLLAGNRWFNEIRRRLGFPYWSLAAFLKRSVKNAVNYIGSFEEAVAREARHRGVDGMICGHIHHAEITRYNDTIYCNCGDWVESCTALVELDDCSLHLLHWSEERRTVKTHVEPVIEVGKAA